MAQRDRTLERCAEQIIATGGADTQDWADYLSICRELARDQRGVIGGKVRNEQIASRLDSTSDQLHDAIIAGDVHVPAGAPRHWDDDLGWAWMHTRDVAWLHARGHFAAARRAIATLADAEAYADAQRAALPRRDHGAWQVADAWPQLDPERLAVCAAGSGRWDTALARQFCARPDAAALAGPLAADPRAWDFVDAVAAVTQADGFAGAGLHLPVRVYTRTTELSDAMHAWLCSRHHAHPQMITELAHDWTGSLHELDQTVTILCDTDCDTRPGTDRHQHER